MRITIMSLLLSLLLAHPLLAAPLSSVAAVVNGEMISSRELDKAVLPELVMNRLSPDNAAHAERIAEIRKSVLDRLISEKVLMQEAKRLELVATDEMVEEELNRMIQESRLSPEQFAVEAEKQGLSLQMLRDRFRTNISTQRLLGRMVFSKVVITEKEIEQYFQESGGTVPAPPPPPPAPEPLPQEPQYEIKITHVRLGMIVYPQNANAEQWAENIASGKNSFESVARRLSVGPNPEGGGDLGMIRAGDLAPGLLDIAYMLKKGDVTPLIDLGTAKAQIKLVDVRTTKKELPAPPPPPPAPVVRQEDYKSDVLDETTTQKIEEFLRRPLLESRFEAYTQQLRDKAIIDIKM